MQMSITTNLLQDINLHTSNTMWPGPRPTCMPSFMLIHRTAGHNTPTSQTGQTDNGLLAQGEPLLQTVTQKGLMSTICFAGGGINQRESSPQCFDHLQILTDGSTFPSKNIKKFIDNFLSNMLPDRINAWYTEINTLPHSAMVTC